MRTPHLALVVALGSLSACNRSSSNGPDLSGVWEALRTELLMTTQVSGYPATTYTSATPNMNTGASVRIRDGATAHPKVTLRISTSTVCEGDADRSGPAGSERLSIAHPHCCDGGCGAGRCELSVTGGALVLQQEGESWSYRFALTRPEQPGPCATESFQRGTFSASGSDFGGRLR